MDVAKILMDYHRLHELNEAVNAACVWEMMSAGVDPTPFISAIPQEFRARFVDERDRLKIEHAATIEAVQAVYYSLKATVAREVGVHDMSAARSLGAGREFRETFTKLAAPYTTMSAMLMTLLDEGDIAAAVWQFLKPRAPTVDSKYSASTIESA
jgi:hypothetical protein